MKIFSCIFAYFVAQVFIESNTVKVQSVDEVEAKLQFKITISKKQTIWFLFFTFRFSPIIYQSCTTFIYKTTLPYISDKLTQSIQGRLYENQ